MSLSPMPWRMFEVAVFVGAAGGAIFGLVRGLRYLPTLPFAIIEGAFLFGVPAVLVGFILVAVWSLGSGVRRHAA